jgi:flagellar L-ring protein precursor FlgH
MNKPWLSLYSGAAWLLVALGTPTLTVASDSLWRDDSKPILADKKASRVGDIVTIVVQQNSSTSKNNSTKTGKKSSVDASLDTFLYSPKGSSFLTKGGQMPAVKWGANSDFTGGGSIDNSEKIVDRITVRVVDTLPNGNLVLEGARQTLASGEKQDVTLRGTVRPEDILANNTVFSYSLADATLRYASKGSLTDSQKKGFLTKVWDKFTPF